MATLSVDVNLTIQNQALETVSLFIDETVQAGMKITDGDLSRWVELRSGEICGVEIYFYSSARKFFLEVHPEPW